MGRKARRMSRLDDVISDVAYVLDSLKALRNIYGTARNCNDCGNRECGYDPDPGQLIRFNCPLWRDKND